MNRTWGRGRYDQPHRRKNAARTVRDKKGNKEQVKELGDLAHMDTDATPVDSPTASTNEVIPPKCDELFLRGVVSATTTYTEGWREVCARLLWAEQQLSKPARTGCDVCLDARKELLSALKTLTADMDRAGGDGYGMPECPWCNAEGSRDYDDKYHNADCELLAARAVIAKAEREDA
jgi:hypothetical protein